MHYFFLEGEKLKPGAVFELTGDNYNHAARVLRLQPGAAVALADGRGTACAGSIVAVTGSTVQVKAGARLEPAESKLNLTLAQGVLKGEKFDQVVRQATELGVKHLQPLNLARSIPRLAGAQDKKRLQRWRKIVRSACAQCRRAGLAGVAAPCSLEDFLAQNKSSLLIVPFEGEKNLSLHKILTGSAPAGGQVVVLTGPEGGFDQKEIALLKNCGALFVSLGPRILRSETAAIAAAALVQAAWGDLS